MRQNKLSYLLFLSIIMMLVASACSSSEASAEDEHMDDEDHAMADMGHMHVDPPEEFASLENPFSGDHEAIEAGEAIFQTNCVPCHGPEGKGDGPSAEALDPKPANLSDGAMMKMMSDGYMFWRVSKGGQVDPFDSAMPAWETSLTEEQRWQVISFARTLPGDDEEGMHEDEHMEEGEHMHEDEHMEEDGMHEEEHMEEGGSSG